jgi:hypothetical protein
VVLLVLHVHATEAVFQIFRESAVLGIHTVVAMEEKIAVVVQWRVHALVAPLILETDGMVATILIAIRLNAEQAIFQRKGIVTAIAVLTFR